METKIVKAKRGHCVRDKKTDLKIAPFKTNLKFALEGTEDKNSISLN